MQAVGYYIKGGSKRLTDSLVAAIEEAGSAVLTSSPATGIDLHPQGAVSSLR